MADVVDKATRSRMMSGIRNKDTGIEISVRKALFARGFRYRLNQQDLPGKPDIVLSRYGAAIFVHGCFWHGHECRLFKWPQTRAAFWRDKIDRNRANDQRAVAALIAGGWRVCVVWECALRKGPEEIDAQIDQIAAWLRGTAPYFEHNDEGLARDK